MTVRELIDKLQSLADDENNRAMDCEVFVYNSDTTKSAQDLFDAMLDGQMFVTSVERDAQNVAAEVTLYISERK